MDNEKNKGEKMSFQKHPIRVKPTSALNETKSKGVSVSRGEFWQSQMMKEEQKRQIEQATGKLRVLDWNKVSLKELRELLDKGAEVNVSDEYSRTPLMYASEKGREDLLSVLLDHGAKINAKDKFGYTSMTYALQEGHYNVMSSLLNKGADVNAKDKFGETLIMRAVESEQLSAVILLVNNKADLNIQNENGETVLMLSKNDKIFSFLLKQDPNLNITDKYGCTLLMRLASQNQLDKIQKVIDKGANINAQDIKGETALIKALKEGYEDVGMILIRNKADINLKDKEGFSVLDYVKENKLLKISDLLKEEKREKYSEIKEKCDNISEEQKRISIQNENKKRNKPLERIFAKKEQREKDNLFKSLSEVIWKLRRSQNGK